MLKIVQLFANKNTDDIYGDIYTSPKQCIADHPDDEVLVGYGVMDTMTEFLVDTSADFYRTEADAEAFIDAADDADPIVTVTP